MQVRSYSKIWRIIVKGRLNMESGDRGCEIRLRRGARKDSNHSDFEGTQKY